MKPLALFCWLVAQVAFAAVASAQSETGTIAGHVTLTTGSAVPGVAITVWNETIAVERRVVSDDNGEYSVGDLPVQGVYTVRAEMGGFATVLQKGITLLPEQREIVDLLLRATATETLVVTGRTPTREHERSTVQQVVSETLVHSLPLVSRDFLTLTSLTAGFTGNPYFPNPQGQFYWANNILVDGASHFSKWRGAARTFNSGYALESINEVQVLSSRFSAEYGESLAAVTLASTNSGTNETHGSALLFLQDDLLNSRPAFTDERPQTGTQRFGFTSGGPVVIDRTHYFGSYEGRRSRLQNPVVATGYTGVTVPSDIDEHIAFFKLDHKNRPSDLLTTRYNGQWFRWHEEPGGLTLPGSGTQHQNDVHTLLVAHTALMSNVTMNQLRVQFARYTERREDLDPSVYVSVASASEQGGRIGPFGFGATPEDTIEASDVLSYKRSTHAYKVGGGIKLVRSHNEALPNGFGSYYFGGFSPTPLLYTQTLATSEAQATVDPRSRSFYAFVQDDWRVTDRLSLNLGVRYDVESIANVRGYDAPADKNNVQPRFGAAWEPVNRRFIVRGGIGLYTQQHVLAYINRAQLEGPDGPVAVTLTPESPLMPVYPATLPATLSSLPPRNIVVVDDNFRNPYSIQATVGVEQSIAGVLVGADYVYLRGLDLVSIVDTNAPASIAKPVLNFRSVAAADATRPIVPVNGGYRQILSLGNEGESWYKGLQIKVTQSAGPFQTILSYTLAKAEDKANYQLPEDSRNLDAEKARADNDIRHNLAAGFTWQLPGGPAVISGWTLSGVGQFRSSRPYTQTFGDDRNGTTQFDARPGSRNTLTTDAFSSVDLAMVRQFHFGPRTLEARVEGFNVLTTTNYDQFVGVLGAFYKQPVTAFPPRRVQIAAVFRF